MSAHSLHRENGQSYACKFLPHGLALTYRSCIFQIISVFDLDTHEALRAATRIRSKAGGASVEPEELKSAISLVGGRLSYLNKVHFIARSVLHETKTYQDVKVARYDLNSKTLTPNGEGLVA
jgi:hypothetical protein